MDKLPIHVFKHSFEPTVELLEEHHIGYELPRPQAIGPVATSGLIEVVLDAAIWASLASVIIAFLKARSGREVIITTRDKKIIHAKGLTAKELEAILEQAKDVKVIDTGK